MSSGIYSNTEILKALESGQIVCHPFIKNNLNGASLNLTLGHYYYRTEYSAESSVYNPFDPKDVKKYFGEKAQKAIIHQDWVKKSSRRLLANIPADHPIIVLRPGERILAHTHEFVGMHPPGTSNLYARSTWGRNGITVCLDAGWGDPGYINRWTLEVYNLNQFHSVALPVGESIAQIVFYHTGEVSSHYAQLSGKYQNSADLKTLIKTWKPEMMLPKAYKDSRRLPEKLKGLKDL